MNSTGIRLGVLARMTESERAQAVASLLAAPVDVSAELANAEARLSVLETQQGMTSKDLRARVDSGEQALTPVVCDWLMLLSERDRLRAAVASRSD